MQLIIITSDKMTTAANKAPPAPTSKGTNKTRAQDNRNQINSHTSNPYTCANKRHMLISCQLVAFISILALTLFTGGHYNLAAAKPLNQNQVKFRRLPPKEFSASWGSSITIECEAGASPPPTIHWLKDGRRISQNELDENQLEDGHSVGAIQVDDATRIALSATRSRLFIDCADLQDEATYTCVAENAYSRVSAHTRLNLMKPQSVTQLAASSDNDLMSGPLDEVTALEMAAKSATDDKTSSGLSAIPQCLSLRQQSARATDSSPARIHMWTHNIVEVMKNNVVLYCRSNIVKQPAATVAAVVSQQLAQSQQQDAATTAYLGSTNSNEQQQQQQLDQDASSASSLPTASLLNENDTTAGKRLFVSWTLPDDKLVSADQKDKYEILETGDLLIKDLRWSDMGSYVCTVSDDQGSDSISAFVYPASVKSSGASANGSNHNKRSSSASNITAKLTHQASRLASFDR